MKMTPFSPLVLPNGAIISNRLAKAAMEENMADDEHVPSEDLFRLYQAWADGGAGLILTGNVMVDRRALTGPGGIVLENDEYLDRFSRWARIGRSKGAHFWMQINHPGRQVLASLGQPTIAPSAVPLELGALSRMFPIPREMTEQEIDDIVQRFARTAALAERAEFTGVEIHAAHGYLISQFLSPLSNRRTDRWGGSLENRARLLRNVIEAVRDQVRNELGAGNRTASPPAVESGKAYGSKASTDHVEARAAGRTGLHGEHQVPDASYQPRSNATSQRVPVVCIDHRTN